MQGRGRREQAGHLPTSRHAFAPAHAYESDLATATRYMDAGEVATLIGVNRETVLRAWRTGHLAGYATNRKIVRFTMMDVQEWMASGRRGRSADRLSSPMRPTGRGRPRRRVQ